MKVCTEPGCPTLVARGSRCPAHQPKDRRPTRTQRGYDAHWQRTRARYLAAHPHCETAGCPRLATDVDHIDGQGPRGPHGHDPDNLRALCHQHHSQRTARDQPGGWNNRLDAA